jgi:HKD family nuclease
MTARLHHQVSGGKRQLHHRLNELLQADNLSRVRFSFAFARWDGLGLISERLEDFLERGGQLESVYGAGNGITSPDALLYGLVLKARYPGRTYAGFIEDEYANALFHPKVCMFRFPGREIALVGSANLTGGGLARNGETMIELPVPDGSQLAKDFAGLWRWLRTTAVEVTAEEVERLARSKGAGREREPEVSKSGKPYLKVPAKLAPKPLFAKVMGLPGASGQIKGKLLGGMGSLTDRPKHLYLQIFERETGGHKGKPGSAIQLPTATLGAYFGLSSGESRAMTFEFLGETVITNVIHNSNSTHQVRLDPIFSVTRPAIIHFERTAHDVFKTRFVPPNMYEATLISRCTQQTRTGSRRWGMYA